MNNHESISNRTPGVGDNSPWGENYTKNLPSFAGGTMANDLIPQAHAKAETSNQKEDQFGFDKFANDEILDKINIQDALREPFKRMMTNFQHKFSEHGYTGRTRYTANGERFDVSYNDYLNEYLLGEGKQVGEQRVLQIGGDDINTSISKNADGFYNCAKSLIGVSPRLLQDSIHQERLEHVLTHEFIHFLVMHDDVSRTQRLANGTFLNEALTELIARDVSGQDSPGSYEPQVRMLNFANQIVGRENNYRTFLRYGIADAKDNTDIHAWTDFIKAANAFEDDYDHDRIGNQMSDAANNEHYLAAQRHLIGSYLGRTTKQLNGIDDYINLVRNCGKRPAPDQAYMDQLFDKIDTQYLKSLKLPEAYESVTLQALKDIRTIADVIGTYEPRASQPKVAELIAEGEQKLSEFSQSFSNEKLADRRIIGEALEKYPGLTSVHKAQLPHSNDHILRQYSIYYGQDKHGNTIPLTGYHLDVTNEVSLSSATSETAEPTTIAGLNTRSVVSEKVLDNQARKLFAKSHNIDLAALSDDEYEQFSSTYDGLAKTDKRHYRQLAANQFPKFAIATIAKHPQVILLDRNCHTGDLCSDELIYSKP